MRCERGFARLFSHRHFHALEDRPRYAEENCKIEPRLSPLRAAVLPLPAQKKPNMQEENAATAVLVRDRRLLSSRVNRKVWKPHPDGATCWRRRRPISSPASRCDTQSLAALAFMSLLALLRSLRRRELFAPSVCRRRITRESRSATWPPSRDGDLSGVLDRCSNVPTGASLPQQRNEDWANIATDSSNLGEHATPSPSSA